MTNAENKTYSTPDEVKGVVRLKDALNTKTYKQNAGSEGSTKHKKNYTLLYNLSTKVSLISLVNCYF